MMMIKQLKLLFIVNSFRSHDLCIRIKCQSSLRFKLPSTAEMVRQFNMHNFTKKKKRLILILIQHTRITTKKGKKKREVN